MNRLFVSDMDGTLLSDNKDLPYDFAETVRKISDAGDFFSFASGRSYMGLKSMYGSYSEDFGYICDNGGNVVFHEKVLKQDTLSKEEIVEISQLLSLHPKLVLIYCGIHTVYVMKNQPMDEEQRKELVHYYPTYSEIESTDDIEDGVLKVAVLFLDDIKKNILPQMKLSAGLEYPVTAYVWIDIFHKNLSKGEGIAELQKHLGITRENTYVFGDYYNDLSLADFAGTSFAMENAVDEVKEKFTYTIGSNEDGAVTKQICKIIESR